MTEREKRTVLAVFSGLINNRYSDLNYFLGSETIREMEHLYMKLKYEDYCAKHGLSSYKDMTFEDYVQYQEENESETEEE